MMSKGRNKTTLPLTDQISKLVKEQIAVQLQLLTNPITTIVSNGVMHMVNAMLQKLEKETTEKIEILKSNVNSSVTTLNSIFAELKTRSNDGETNISYLKDQLAGLIENNTVTHHQGKQEELDEIPEDTINCKVALLDHKISALELRVELERSQFISAKNQLSGLQSRLSGVEKKNRSKEFVISGLKVNKSAKEDTIDLLVHKLGIGKSWYEVKEARRANVSTPGKPPLLFVKLGHSSQVSRVMLKKSKLRHNMKEVRINPYLNKLKQAMYRHTTEMFWQFKQRQPTAVVQFIVRFGIEVDGKKYISNGTQLMEWGCNPG